MHLTRGAGRSDNDFMTTRRGIFMLIGVLVVGLWPGRPVLGADLEEAFLRMDRMKASTATNVRVVFKVPAGNSGTEAKVKVTFGAGMTVAAATVNTTGITGTSNGTADNPVALPGTLSIANSGQDLTVTGVTNLSASTWYGFNIATGVTNGSAAQYVNSITTLTSGDATVDTKQVATRVIADDQIVITAVVPPTFNFTLSGNTDAFTSSLSVSSVVSTTGVTATLVTNGGNGWIAWVKSANAALSSAAASYTIDSAGDATNATPTTLSTGSEDYVLDVDLTTDSGTAGSGTVTVAGEYNGDSTSKGGTLTTGYTKIASADGPTDGDVLTLIERATISGMTPAATDYTDTLTVVGAGVF